MALTSRDIMFSLRAQDMASRQVRGVANSFSRLQRQLTMVDDIMRSRMSDSQQKYNSAIAKTDGQLKQVANTLDRRTTAAQQRHSAAIAETTKQYDQLKKRRTSRDAEIEATRERDLTAIKRRRNAEEAKLNELLHNGSATSRQRRAEMDRMAQSTRAALSGQAEMTKQYHRGADARRTDLAVIRNQNAEAQRLLRTDKELTDAQKRRITNDIKARREQADIIHSSGQLARLEHERRLGEIRTLEATEKAQVNSWYQRLTRRRQQDGQFYAERHKQRIADLDQARTAEIARANEQAEFGRRRVDMTRRTAAQVLAAEKQAAEQQAAQQRRVIQLRQQQMQQMMAVGAAATLMGAVMAGVGARIVNSLTGAVRAAADFRMELALAVTQSLGTANATVDQLSDIALRVGREIPAALSEMPQTLFYIFTAMSVTVAESEELLRGFAREAVAGNASIEDSAKSTIAILNGMALTVEDLERVQDFQFQTVRRGVITYDQLSSNIGKLIPALRRSGQEIESGGAMLQFLTRQGLSAEMATTAAARALELIADPRVVRRLEDMGISIRDDVSGEFLDLHTILSQLNDEFAGLAAPDRAQAMLDLFGGAGYRIQARRFFDTVFANWEEFSWHVGEAIDNVGAFEEAYALIAQEPAARLQLLENQFAALRQEMGEALLPVMEMVMDAVRGIVDWFSSLDEETRNQIVRFGAFAGIGLMVVGALTAIAGVGLTAASMLVTLGISARTAMGLVAGFIPVVATLSTIFGLIFLNGFSLGDLFESMGRWFGSAEGKALALAAALGAITIAYGLFQTSMTAGSVVGAIVGGFERIRRAVSNVAAGLQLLSLNPVMIGLVAATTAAVGIWTIFRNRSQQVKEAVEAHTTAQKSLNEALLEGNEALNSYTRDSRELGRETALEALREADLVHALNNTRRLRSGQYLDAIVGTTEAREEAVRLLEAEIAANQRRYRSIGGQGPEARELQHNISQRRQLIDVLRVQGEAYDTARADALAELEVQGELGTKIAEYIRLYERGGAARQFAEAVVRREIDQLVELRDGYENLDPTMRTALENIDGIAEGTEDLNELLETSTGLANGFKSAMESLTGPTAGWARGLELANEAVQRHNDSLAEGQEARQNFTDQTLTKDAWLEGIRAMNDEVDSLFANMAGVMSTHGEAMGTSAGDVMGAILEMGNAGPRAMELLNSMNAEEFMEFLRSIQIQTALTSDEVVNSIDEMIAHIQANQEEFAEINDQQWGAIMQDMVLLIHSHGELATENMGEIINTMSGLVAAGVEPASDQMNRLMNAMIIAITERGRDMASEATAAGESVAEGMNSGLRGGLVGIARTMAGYGASIGEGVNPILTALGLSRISSIVSFISILSRMRAAGGFNSGGLVPGRGPNMDTIPAMLTGGEYVLRRQAVDNLDLHSLNELNRTGDISTLVRHYNSGGFVTAGDVPRPPTSFNGPVHPLTAPASGAMEDMYEKTKKYVQENAIPPLGPGIGWQKMWETVNRRFPGVRLHSAYRPGAITATGNPSYHGMGRAIDISPRMDIFNWLAQNYRNSREIIFSPANSRQIHNGRNHMYSGITRSMHFDHIHWAMANGGMVNGPTPALIGEAGPEVVIPLDRLGGIFSQAVGDGLGIGDNYTGNFTGGVSGISGWASRAMPKYQKVMREATAENIASVRAMSAAVQAMQKHVAAQRDLDNARKHVEAVRREIVKLASDAEKAELALAQALARGNPQGELDAISARQNVRKLQQQYDEFHNGVYNLNQELTELQQEQRIAQMRQQLEELGEGDFANIEELKTNLQQAQATLAGAEFEWARVQTILPTMTDEVEKLLLRFQTENALADAQQGVLDASKALQESERENANSLHARRIAEIELALAEKQLEETRRQRLYTDEAMRQAQLELQLAQEALTQAERDAVGPSEEARAAQERLKEIREAQKEAAENLKQAQIDVSLAEFDAVEATLGLIAAGQELTSHGPEQVRFFRELAAAAGMSADSITRTISATKQLQQNSADIQKAISQHKGVDRKAVEGGFDEVYNRIKAIFDNRRVRIADPSIGENERQRLTRMTHEVLSGERTLDNVRASVDRLARLGIGTYDRGGILPPGLNLVNNATGGPEYVYTKDQNANILSGGSSTTLIVEAGAFTFTTSGEMSEDTKSEIEEMLEKFIEELDTQLRS